MSACSAVRSATVLYVEDEEYDSYFMGLAFKRSGNGLSLKRVADGQEAIDYLSGNHQYHDREEYPMPNLLLLDLNLPVISGLEVLQWVKRQSGLRSLPVVVFTSSALAEDKGKAAKLGADAYLAKPSSAMQFGQVIEELKRRWLSDPCAEVKEAILPLLLLLGLFYSVARWL